MDHREDGYRGRAVRLARPRVPATCAAPRYSRPLARRDCRSSLARRGSFNVRGDAATQRFHEIDHPVRRGKHLLALWNGAGLLGPEVGQQRLVVAVAKGRGVKLAGLAVENML